MNIFQSTALNLGQNESHAKKERTEPCRKQKNIDFKRITVVQKLLWKIEFCKFYSVKKEP